MNRRILDLAIPNIISNITVPLLSMVDLAVLGHLESEIYIGAIALGGIVFNFVYWGFGFLRMGTSGLTAQAFGAKKEREITLVLSRALLVGLSSAILIILLQFPIAWISFHLLQGSPGVEELAKSYFYIRIYAAPATIGLYAFTGWFLGMQNARYPMVIAIVVNILNIGFNLLFVYRFGMKSDGVALGTVIAQYSGLGLAVLLFLKKYRNYVRYWNRKAMMQADALKKFLSVNKDILIRTLLLLFAFAFFTSQSAGINDRILAVNTLLLQFLFIFSYFIDGYAHAAEALVGRYTGAADIKMLKKAVRYLFIWGIAISGPFTLAYLFTGKHLLRILTDQPELIDLSATYLPWVALIPFVSFAAFIWDGAYIGATATSWMRNLMVISSLAVFLPVYYLSRDSLGNHGLWLAMISFMLSRSIFMSVFSKKALFRNLNTRAN
jgi:MATE family multidrug resistance protein